MDQAAGPDFRPHEVSEPDLEPDREQQQEYTHVGDLVQHLVFFESGRIENESRGKKTDKRRHAEPLHREPEQKRGTDPDCFHDYPGLFTSGR